MKIQTSLKSILILSLSLAAGLPSAWAGRPDTCPDQEPLPLGTVDELKTGIVSYALCRFTRDTETPITSEVHDAAKTAAAAEVSRVLDPKKSQWAEMPRAEKDALTKTAIRNAEVTVVQATRQIRSAVAADASVVTGNLQNVIGGGNGGQIPPAAPRVVTPPADREHDLIDPTLNARSGGAPSEEQIRQYVEQQKIKDAEKLKNAETLVAADNKTKHSSVNGFAKSALFGAIGLGAMNMFANKQAGEGSLLSSLTTYGAMIGGTYAAMKYGGTAGTIAALGVNGAIAVYSLFKARHTLAEHEKAEKAKKAKKDDGTDDGDDNTPPVDDGGDDTGTEGGNEPPPVPDTTGDPAAAGLASTGAGTTGA